MTVSGINDRIHCSEQCDVRTFLAGSSRVAARTVTFATDVMARLACGTATLLTAAFAERSRSARCTQQAINQFNTAREHFDGNARSLKTTSTFYFFLNNSVVRN